MARILFQLVFPILLPTLLYALWLAAERRRVEAAGTGEKPAWNDAPWFWLAALGVFFAGVIAVALALLGGGDMEGTYIPPSLRDGEVVPGRVQPR